MTKLRQPFESGCKFVISRRRRQTGTLRRTGRPRTVRWRRGRSLHRAPPQAARAHRGRRSAARDSRLVRQPHSDRPAQVLALGSRRHTLSRVRRRRAQVELAKLGDYVTATIAAALTSAGFAADHLGPLHPGDVQVARTASRSVLGFMNDMAATAEYITARAGGITRVDVPELNAPCSASPTTATATSAPSTPFGRQAPGAH